MSEHKSPIPSRIYNAAVGGHICGTEDIIDDDKNKTQKQINSEVEESLGTGGSVDSRIASAVATEASRAQTEEGALQQLYENLTQSDIVVTEDHTQAASPSANIIYREPGTTSYSDWMYYNNAWKKMAEYDNAIDDEPTEGSDNLVKSGGVYDTIEPISDDVNKLKLEVEGGDEPEPIKVDTIINEFRRDPTNDWCFFMNVHSTSKIEIYDVTNYKGRTISFNAWKYNNNNYVDYALVKNYENIPKPISSADITANLEVYKAAWQSCEAVDVHYSGAVPDSIVIPNTTGNLYIIIQTNTSTQTSGSQLTLLDRKTYDSLLSKVTEIEEQVSTLSNNEATSYDDSILLRKYIIEKYRDANDTPYYINEDVNNAVSFDDIPYLDKKIKDISPKNSFAWITDIHEYSLNDVTPETSAKKFGVLIDYIRKRAGFSKVLFGGDAFNAADNKFIAAAMLKGFSDDFFSSFGKDGILCIGNHDCNGAMYRRTQDVNVLIPDTEVYIRTVKQASMSNIVYDERIVTAIDEAISDGALTITSSDKEQLLAWCKMHYYVDDVHSKTRFIVLESNDEGYSTTRTLGISGYNSTLSMQFNFVIDALNSLPDGYNIVVVAHNMYQSAESVYTDYNASSQQVEVRIGGNWTATINNGADWITFPASGSGNSCTVSIAENTTQETRSCTLKFTRQDTGSVVSVGIVQYYNGYTGTIDTSNNGKLVYGINNININLARILGAFKTKSTVSLNLGGSSTHLVIAQYINGSSTLSCDFSGRTGNIGKVMCLFGHIHESSAFIVQSTNGVPETPSREYYGMGCYPYSNGMTLKDDAVLFVSTNADSYRMDRIDYPFGDNPSGVAMRTELGVVDTLTEHSFDIVSFVNNGIKMTRIGAGNDRMFLY